VIAFPREAKLRSAGRSGSGPSAAAEAGQKVNAATNCDYRGLTRGTRAEGLIEL
jgi:hypothetical protein